MPPKGQPPTRLWGTRFDSLTTPSPSASSSDASSPSHNASAALAVTPLDPGTIPVISKSPANTAGNDERVYKDANLFVGSLPTGVDHAELGQRLSEHLAAYAPGGVKVNKIFDSKDGSCKCAFVYCADANAADNIINSFQARPVPFMGRSLRYERARDQRQLIVSYRAPTGTVPIDEVGVQSVPVGASEPAAQLRPATAMRLRRLTGSRVVDALFNEDAAQERSVGDADGGDSLSGAGILFRPLLYDADTMHRMLSAFGPIEHFARRSDSARSSDTEHHSAPKSDCMDSGCWEVKWQHRDDCVTAYQTLRTVNHLTVTWANARPPFAPRHQGGQNIRPSWSPSPNRTQTSPSGFSSWNSPNRRFSRDGHLDPGYVPSHLRTATHSSSVDADVDTAAGTVGSAPSSRQPSANGEASGTPSIADSPSSQLTRIHISEAPEPSEPSDVLRFGSVTGHTFSKSWGDEPLSGTEEDEQRSVSPEVISRHIPSRSDGAVSTNPVANGESENSSHDPNGIFPPPIVHRSLTLPIPPTGSFAARPYVSDSHHYGEYGVRSPEFPASRPGDRRPVDPATIFVGGLDKYGSAAWSEEKVAEVFEQYGEIVDLKFITPTYNKSAFAFVTYANPQSSMRAIQEQHNRIHDGREIRVQLRTVDSHHRRFGARTPNGRPGNERTPMIHGRLTYVDGRHRRPDGENLRARLHPDALQGQVRDVETLPQTYPTQPSPEGASVPLYPSHHPPAAVQGLPYPMANGAYYPGPQWYGPPYPPVMPTGPPGYPAPQPVGQSLSEGTGVAVYQAYSYPSYPMAAPVRSLSEQTGRPASEVDSQHRPLVPLGFMQGDQGLMPLYHPDALDNHLHDSGGQYAPHPNTAHSEEAQRSASTPVSGPWHPSLYPPFYSAPGSGGATPVPYNPHYYPGQGYMNHGYWYPTPAPLMPAPSQPAAVHPSPVHAAANGTNGAGTNGRTTGPGRYNNAQRGHGNFRRQPRRDYVPSAHNMGAHGQPPANSFAGASNHGGAVSMYNISSRPGGASDFYRSSDSPSSRPPLRQSTSSPAFFDPIGARSMSDSGIPS
ncbi:hypothetical protein FA95DRAFT_1332918 [Auriscalpium vulgare]|uniref:Uncharacterized protein n=1 Tax=Auriscalpium vulgare TaxID=40419 RepID=A0ACB8S9C5_9AGAM|nr:hypothetical protein FA95DRAFT_1332918 [Auriscalpium vulgare]